MNFSRDMKTEIAKALPAFPCAAQLAPGHRAADAGRPQRRQLAGASTTGQGAGSPAGTPPESPGQAQLALPPQKTQAAGTQPSTGAAFPAFALYSVEGSKGPGINTTTMKDTSHSTACPAQHTGSPAAQLAAAPVVNIYLTGCNINNGRNQIVGNHNTQIGQNAYGPADLSQWQAETIRAQAATIAAQQRTIDRLITILEGRTAGA